MSYIIKCKASGLMFSRITEAGIEITSKVEKAMRFVAVHNGMAIYLRNNFGSFDWQAVKTEG